MCTCMCAYGCVYMCIWLLVCVRVCDVHVCVHVCLYVCVWLHVCVLVCMHMSVYMCACMCAYGCLYVCLYVRCMLWRLVDLTFPPIPFPPSLLITSPLLRLALKSPSPPPSLVLCGALWHCMWLLLVSVSEARLDNCRFNCDWVLCSYQCEMMITID